MNNAALDLEPAWVAGWATDLETSLGINRFHSNRDDNAEVYVMNVDGSAQTRLTNNAGFDENPAWSPDGLHISFDSSRDGNPEIYAMNADGTAPTRLTANPAYDQHPAFTP
jgi:Tol biopolymer transport system component